MRNLLRTVLLAALIGSPAAVQAQAPACGRVPIQSLYDPFGPYGGCAPWSAPWEYDTGGDNDKRPELPRFKPAGRRATSCPTTACISSRDKAATLPSPLDGEAPDDGSRSRASGDPLQQEVVGNQHRAVPDLNREVGRAGVTSKADALSLATVVNGNTVFTFDTGDVLIVENIADPTLLRDDLAIV